MKIDRNIFIIILLLVSLSSCDKWLDVSPKNQVTDEELFKNGEGFRNALNGVYEMLSSQELYGRELSWGFLSVLAQTYDDNDIEQAYSGLVKYQYGLEGNKEIISTIWSKSYKAIANCNKLISEIEGKKGSFFELGEAEKNLIMGEAYALRAFIHFDLLRLFAPAPVTSDGGNYIPYFSVYPSKFEGKKTVSQIMELVIQDFLTAKDLVASYDTVYNKWYMASPEARLQVSEAADGGRFFTLRGGRMNYMAIQGLLARAYMYAGDLTNAEKYCREILTRYVLDEGGEDMINFTEKNFVSTVDKKFYVKYWNDIIFALYDDHLLEKIADFKVSTKASMYVKDWDAMFTGRNDGLDYRAYQKQSIPGSSNVVTKKWLDLDTDEQLVHAQEPLIPILRLSEIYYILSECLVAKETTKAEGVAYMNKVRAKRGALREISVDNYMDELIWEGKKEYLAEGQAFFLFKRLNRPIVSGTQVIQMDKSKFVLPIPENENIY